MTFLQITPLNFWPVCLLASPNWVGSPDSKIRHEAHRRLGRELKRHVLAVGGREVHRGVPSGYPRGPMPMCEKPRR